MAEILPIRHKTLNNQFINTVLKNVDRPFLYKMVEHFARLKYALLRYDRPD